MTEQAFIEFVLRMNLAEGGRRYKFGFRDLKIGLKAHLQSKPGQKSSKRDFTEGRFINYKILCNVKVITPK